MENSGGPMKRYSLFLLTFILYIIITVIPGFANDKGQEIVLDADTLTYQETTGIGVARGNVNLRLDDMNMSAPYMEIDSSRSIVRAVSESGKLVSIRQGSKILKGRSLHYDILKREGTLYDAEGSVPAQKGYVFMNGGRVNIVPASSAAKEGSIEDNGSIAEDEGSFVGQWHDVTLTTCTDPEPHYRVVTRRLIIIPGKRVIAKTPDIYIGKHKLFRYPFDYIVDLKKQEHNPFMPSIHYDSDKGAGLGIKPRFYPDERSVVNLTLTEWSDTGFEWKGRYTRDMGDGLSLFAESAYEYDSDVEEKEYRPEWGLNLNNNGWTGHLKWSQREPRDTELRSGEIYRTTLWRDPEFYIRTPWWDDPASDNTFFSLSGSWGSYEEREKSTDRTSWGLHLKGEGDLGTSISHYWRANYRYFDYSAGDTQEVTELILGLRYSLGDIDLGSSYRRRWADGGSPLWWDDYDELEKFYQQVDIPFVNDTRFKFRTSYNIQTEEFNERIYQLTVDRDCLKWIFIYRDDLVDENDDWAAVRLVIKAFPDTDLALDSRQVDAAYE